jgi:ABC-2 type transport system permease protein/ribosome-dependent ATPase
MIRRILAVAGKEVREIRRVRLFLILAFAVPFVMFIVFGYGISLDIEHMPFSYVDQDRSQLSARLVDKFRGRYFEVGAETPDLAAADRLLTAGKLRAVLVIPPDFSRKLYRGGRADLQLLIDGGYPYRALTMKGYAQAIVSSFSMELIADRLLKSGRAGLLVMPVNVETRYFFNESLRSSNALVPGLITIILLMNPAVLTALAIAREKEFGTIYNVYSTPIKKWEFLTGKLIPYIAISALNFTVIITTIKLLFNVPMKGDLITLLPAALLYVMINVSIGLLVSTVTRTIVSAQIVTIIITVIPAFLYSGLLIPVSNLQGEGKIMAHLYPSMHFMQVVHGVYLKNLGMTYLFPQILILGGYFILVFTVAVSVFRKREG